MPLCQINFESQILALWKIFFLGLAIEESLQPNWFIPTYTFIHICVLSKNAKSDSFFFFSGKITFVSTTPPCGHGDESRHCRQASGQTVPQNLHTETWKCQVKYCIATHKLQQMINWLGMKNVRFTHYYYGLRCIHGLRPNRIELPYIPKTLLCILLK